MNININYKLKYFIIILIKLYRFLISPLLGNNCRFYPSCSSYAIEAINKFGILKGCYYTLTRLIKCNPFFDGGYDPVPNDDKQ